jgi:hypothetical protein
MGVEGYEKVTLSRRRVIMIKGDQELGLWLVQNRIYQNEVAVFQTAGCTDDYTQTSLKSDPKTTAIQAGPISND